MGPQGGGAESGQEAVAAVQPNDEDLDNGICYLASRSGWICERCS